jgi:hypothetical protein
MFKKILKTFVECLVILILFCLFSLLLQKCGILKLTNTNYEISSKSQVVYYKIAVESDRYFFNKKRMSRKSAHPVNTNTRTSHP